MTSPAGPPAGWYPDPAGGGGARWWDGTRWTPYTAAVPPLRPGPATPAVQAPQPYGQAPQPYGQAPQPYGQAQPPWAGYATSLVERELRFTVWGRVSLLGFLALSAVAAVHEVVSASSLAEYFHWVRIVMDSSRAAGGAVAPSEPAAAANFFEVDRFFVFSDAAVAVVFWIWQYRAAKAARWLGLPARHTPGWGVGFWFVPFANWWCPFQALRDCLPPGTKDRRPLACWLAYLATELLGLALAVAAPYARPAAFVLFAVDVALLGLVGVAGWRLIGEIARAHRVQAGLAAG